MEGVGSMSLVETIKRADSSEETLAVSSFKQLCLDFKNLQEGSGRHTELNKLAFQAGIRIAEGHLTEHWATQRITEAADANGTVAKHGLSEVERVIAAGLTAGLSDAKERRVRDNPIYGYAMNSKQLKQLPPAKWVIDGVQLENSLMVLVGAPGCGKSFLAMDMVGCLANKNNWLGHKISENRTALYVLGEGVVGLPDRVAAWETFNEMPMNGVTFVPRAVPIGTRSWDYLVSYAEDEKPGLIVIDTLARMAGDMESENDARQMGKFIEAVDKVRIASEGSVLVIHHTNRMGGMRGSNALDGAADTIIKAQEGDTHGTIDVFTTKVKEGALGGLGTFKFESIDRSAVLRKIGPVPWQRG